MSVISRRDILKRLGVSAVAIAAPITVAVTAQPKYWWRTVKWLEVRSQRRFDLGGYVVSAYYRDCSVPVGERRAYAVGYRVSRELLHDIGPKKMKTLMTDLKGHAAKMVLAADRGLPSEAARLAEGECIMYVPIPESILKAART